MNSLESAIQSLAARCDLAISLDGQGFNKLDAYLGHKLAEIPETSWTPRQRRASWAMLRKYTGQLSSLGIDYDAIPEPPKLEPTEKKPAKFVTIDDAGYVRIYFPYDPPLVAAAKAIPGARFDGARKNWYVKLARDNAQEIMKFAVSRDFEFADKLMDSIEALFIEYTEKLEASRAKEADLEISGLGGELRSFQKAGVAYAIKAKRAFIADEMGLGKTVEALAVLQAEQAFPAAIVCPASLKLNWRREAEKWLPDRQVAIINGKKNECWEKADVVIFNYDVLKKNLEALQGMGLNAIVFDESHYCKNYKAQRTEAAKALAKNIPIRLALTGTPVLNRPQELLSQLQIIGRLDEMGGFWAFAKRYCNAYKARFGWDMSGAAHLDELNEKLRANCYVRRTKEEVLTELPPKTRSILPVEITNRKEYDRAEKDVVAWLGSQAAKEEAFLKSVANLSPENQARAIADHRMSAEESAARAEQLVRIEALKQLSAKGKMEAVGEWVESFLETGEKLVIFAHHHTVVEELAQRFNAPAITGQTPIETRQSFVDRFQTDPGCRVIVCNIKAGGVGITLTAASNVAFVELEWTPAAHDQAEDRCHRIGQTDSVTAWYLLGQGTIDEEIMSLIDKKRVVVDAATEGHQEILGEAGIMNELVRQLREGKK